MIRFVRTREILSTSVIALTAMAFAVMFFLMPYFSDDFWYMAPVRGVIEGRESIPDLRAVMESVRFHYLTDNGRLCNSVFTLLLCLPKWVLAGLTSILCGASILMLARLARLSPRRPAGAVWLCFLFATTLPWYDGILSFCFQFNYVWSMALVLLALLLFLSPRRRSPMLLFVLGLTVGAWHEGFSAPLLGACAVLALWRPRRFLAPDRIALMSGLLLGFLFLLSSPSFFRYTGGSIETNALFDPRNWFRAIRLNILPLFALGVLFVAVVRPASRRRVMHAAPMACAFMLLFGFIIDEYMPVFERVSFCCRLMAVPLLVFLFSRLFRLRHPSVRSALSRLTTVAAAVFLFVHLAFAISATERLRKGMEKAAGPDVFIDFPWSADADFLALGKPFSLNGEYFLDLNDTFRLRESLPPLTFAPRELEFASATTGRPFPGMPGLRILDGRLYIPVDSATALAGPDPYIARVRYGASLWRPRVIIPRRFVSRADSTEYYFLSIQELYPYGRFAEPTALDW